MTEYEIGLECDSCEARDCVRLVVIVDQATGAGGGRHACTACVPLGDGVLDEVAES